MDGARTLMRTLVESGVTTLFTNPGTTELHLVEAAEATPGLRSVLALFEGVVSGAADGYGRIAGRPAATLVHLGPGQGNAWANFHNAREHLNITTIILKNSSYGILREEWEHLQEQGQNELHDSPLINLGGAPLDFTGLAQSMGVPAAHADTSEELAEHLTRALTEPGPHLIEAVVPAIV